MQMPDKIHFLSSLIFILHTMLRKITLKYYIKLSMFTSNSCPYEGRWMLTGLQRLFTVSFISRHLMTYHTPPRMTLKPVSCLLPGNHSILLLLGQEMLDPLLWGTQSIFARIAFSPHHEDCSPTAWPSVSEFPSFLMIQHFPSLISIFSPHLFVQSSFL